MYKTEGIVLKKIDAGETDALFTIYTKDFGKIRAVAQGVKKEEAKLKGHLEPLSLASLQFVSGRNGERLTHAELFEYWPRLKEDREKLKTAYLVVELVDKECFGGEKDPRIWNLLVSTLASLNQEVFTDQELAKFSANFEKQLLAGV
jgi:DNA repair protein RecO (recombination protein O)